jgi:hypothetical protein
MFPGIRRSQARPARTARQRPHRSKKAELPGARGRPHGRQAARLPALTAGITRLLARTRSFYYSY